MKADGSVALVRALLLGLCLLAGCDFAIAGVDGHDNPTGDLGGAEHVGSNDLAVAGDLAVAPPAAGDLAQAPLFYPRAPISRSFFETAGLTAVDFASGGGIGTDTGLIGAADTPLRHANSDPNSYEVHDGIGFVLLALPAQPTKLGVYTFASLKLEAGIALNAYGSAGLALVSAGDMTIAGTVDVTCAANIFLASTPSPYLAGPGGGAGGQPGTDNSGVSLASGAGGAGGPNTQKAGGGGGAFGDAGGAGGDNGGNKAGHASTAYGDPALMLLVGGSGGGAGGQGSSQNRSFGGGGGGVAVLVAQGTLTIGGGGMLGGVNAGGCGGTAAAAVGGGGGGAGGAILLEAPTVNVAANGAVAANGGSGSGGNAATSTATNGHSGALSTTPAPGGSGGNAMGGVGGVASAPAGGTGTSGGNAGAGGGGAVGRIRIESTSGSASLGGIQSPVASQGRVDIH